MKERVVVVDSTHVHAYSQRVPENRNKRSDLEARFNRGRRDFILGYLVNTAYCADLEFPLAFTMAPCNMKDKKYFKPLLKEVHGLGL